ncbi:threonine aldolase family protein [Sphingobacterium suaedae]|uniref:Threonine aldolase family protein n=1 Tax=Sphingobacterium suaedae TaxID=1686402 RepID=A0ABW5KGF0_9SPHI
MYSFKNDYSEGAHPSVLEKLAITNFQQENGYGEDTYSRAAKDKLRAEMQNDEAVIHFVSGGTQTNLLVISYLLRPHEAVISAQTGHIYANETGAIEATGHRIIPVLSTNGKVTPEAIEEVLNAHYLRPHVVKPKLVYISNSTEIGSIYTREELQALYHLCEARQLFLFLDGARLGHALTATESNLTLADVAKYTHVFYIGGTKNGALLGEAIVFRRQDIAQDFDYSLKQKGALLAKGRILGIQFDQLFTDNLYYHLARHANEMAMQIASHMRQLGCDFLTVPTTNQLFPILPKVVIDALSESYAFYIWSNIDEQHDAIRIITSWATQQSTVSQFNKDFTRIYENYLPIR